MKSLKIPKGYSEYLNRWRTDNTMAKRKGQKVKQRSTKHTHKTKDWIKTRGELRCSGRVSSSYSTSGTSRVNLFTNPVIRLEWGNDREVLLTCGVISIIELCLAYKLFTQPYIFTTETSLALRRNRMKHALLCDRHNDPVLSIKIFLRSFVKRDRRH